MATGNPIKAYSKANNTAAKTRQVVMLYDGAIRFLQQAKDAMEKIPGDLSAIETRYNKLTKAAEIIMGLQACLDFDTGGDAAKILYDFYAGVDMRILTLHRTNDVKHCEQLIEEIRRMRDTWDQIDRGVNASAASAPASPPPAAPSPDTSLTVSA
jgi:flagellar protein FliS